MYTGPIIDPHHHLWDLSMGQHPWLKPGDKPVAALAGMAAVAQDHGVDDYLRDAAGENIVATVHIEALWAGNPVGETRWLETLDKRHGIALRYVVNARLGTIGAAQILAEQVAYPRVVGVRGILSHHPDPMKSFVSDFRLAYDSAWRRDVALLRDHGLHLELMMYPHQVEAVLDLGRVFPDLTIIINHCGSPIDRDRTGMQRWWTALRMIASLPNVALKISNPGAYDPAWTQDSVREVILHCIDCFGSNRAMFGTDYPVSRINMSFKEIYATFRSAVSTLSRADQGKLFFENARRFYRLDHEVAA